MKKIFSGLLSIMFLLMAFFVPKLALADGMGISYDPLSDRWDFSDETNQQAFISHENGLEKMIISTGFNGNNSKGTVWLFPIPADPSKIAIDVVANLPKLSGAELKKQFKSDSMEMLSSFQYSQIYTIPFIFIHGALYNATGATGNDSLGLKESSMPLSSDITVHEHLDKEGISSEIITAKTADGIYNYLTSKGLKIESGAIPVLNNYIGKNYSFVVSWISQPQQIISGGAVKAPQPIQRMTDEELEAKIVRDLERIFSKLSSEEIKEFIEIEKKVYPEISKIFDKSPFDFKSFVSSHHNASNDVTNFLMTHERPDIIKENVDIFMKEREANIKKNAATSQIVNNQVISDNNLQKIDYQKGISVTFPTKEIYFPLMPTSVYGSKIVPATIRVIGFVSPRVFEDIKSYVKTEYYYDKFSNNNFNDNLKFFHESPEPIVLYTKIEINAPSKFFTDDLWFDDKAPLINYFVTFLISNQRNWGVALFLFCSILASVIAGFTVFKDLRWNPLKLILFGLSNCLTLLGLIIVVFLIDTKNKIENKGIDLIIEKIKQKGYFWKRRVAILLYVIAFLFIIFSIVFFMFRILWIFVFIAAVKVNNIKSEDKSLFEQLESYGYSTWTFSPKDKMKYAFVPLFSGLFLFLSWGIVKIIEIML